MNSSFNKLFLPRIESIPDFIDFIALQLNVENEFPQYEMSIKHSNFGSVIIFSILQQECLCVSAFKDLNIYNFKQTVQIKTISYYVYNETFPIFNAAEYVEPVINATIKQLKLNKYYIPSNEYYI